ncbi:copper homeostasis membrane protein CopD [Dickeya lacustris]|uniref:Copper resistance protein D n=1 Tax=Dickeya lacustris TaxID=2259638 RepID=A0ABY8G8A6_9GAMM|nr:copper homeostasis membrane protein CopD [Dickeya lacustris]WFN56167.1 copper homeostasis membrane protein CopD [Dickeya lacustris]
MAALAFGYVLLRGLYFTSVMLLAGVGCLAGGLAPLSYRARLVGRLRIVTGVCCLIAVSSALGILCLQVGLMSGDEANIADIATWRAMLGTEFGRVWRWQPLLALVACYGAFRPRASHARWLLLCCVLQLLATSWLGHAAMQEGWPAFFHGINQALHILAAAFWFGGLAPLAVVVRDTHNPACRALAITTLMRFSYYGHLAVALVVVTGVINTLLILGWPISASLVYGGLLGVKVLLVVIMVLLALFNRYWVVPRFREAPAHSTRYFLYVTYSEWLLAVGVIALVSLFATLSPI